VFKGILLFMLLSGETLTHYHIRFGAAQSAGKTQQESEHA